MDGYMVSSSFNFLRLPALFKGWKPEEIEGGTYQI